MRFPKHFRSATAAIWVAVLCVPGAEGEELVNSPIAKPTPAAGTVPVAEPVSNSGEIPAPPVVSEGQRVPAAMPVPVAEPIPAEPVSDSEEESNATPVPAAEMIVAPATAPTAEPVPVAEPIPAEPVMNDESVPVVEPTTAESTTRVEAVSAGNLQPSVDMTAASGSLDSILAPDLDPSADTNPYTEEILALGPPWIAPEEDTMTLREMFLQSHREQLEIYDLNHDNVISEEEWKAANEDDLARGEKFFVVDKNEDGEIDENEAVGFLMERVSLSSTYIDATSEDSADITRGDIKEHAPSELRVTLFSIPLGD